MKEKEYKGKPVGTMNLVEYIEHAKTLQPMLQISRVKVSEYADRLIALGGDDGYESSHDQLVECISILRSVMSDIGYQSIVDASDWALSLPQFSQ